MARPEKAAKLLTAARAKAGHGKGKATGKSVDHLVAAATARAVAGHRSVTRGRPGIEARIAAARAQLGAARTRD